MKKALKSFFGVACLVALMSTGLLISHAAASTSSTSGITLSSSTGEYVVLASSRYVEKYRYGYGTPTDRVWYEDAYGYSGYIYLKDWWGDGTGEFSALYAGTVYCEGTCVAPSNIK